MERDLYRLLVEETRDALIALAPDGHVLFWNRGAADMFGYTAEEARASNLVDLLVPPERRDEELSLLREADAGLVATRESVRQRKDGERIFVNISTRAVREEDGQLKFFITVKQDITVQRALRDARLVGERYHDLFDAVPDAIVVVNETGRMLLFNQNAERLFGYRRDEVIGKPVELLLPERARAAHLGHRASFAATPRARNMGSGLSLFGRRRDNSEFPVEVSLSPLSMSEGGTLVVSAIRDISERKLAEEALQQKNAELELANQAKDRFFATMSHELRTPLNAIVGFTGILLMRLPGPLVAEQERQLQLVEQSAMHLLSLINDLLDLATIQSGGTELHLEDCDMIELVRTLDAMFQPLASTKGVALTSAVPDVPCVLRTDRRAVRQIVINLLNNALKFSPDGRVELCLARHLAPLRYELSVTDTGVGIADQDLARLFKPFSRVGSSARRVEGTGLGLHLSQRLCQLLGARLEVESKVGEGSRFSVTFEG
jgi:PAS domain S-box-containing protein